MKNFRIVFMGTPEFAVATLGSLLINGYDVACVVTAPDKPSGRGQKITRPAVGVYADTMSIPVLQPVSLRDPVFTDNLKRFNADVFVVVAFRMLPEVVWRIPSTGTINLHASLLPQYRGAAPINHVIINGEAHTGVTTFLIDDRIDTGGILLREEINIGPGENAGELHDRLMKHGARLVIKTLQGLAEHTLKPLPQSHFMSPGEILKPAPRIFPDDCFIDWKKDPSTINNLIRGLSPYPGARTMFSKGENNILFKIYEADALEHIHDYAPGTLLSGSPDQLKVACTGGFIRIMTLQPEGKKAMTAPEFLRGIRLTDYNIRIS